MDENNVLNNETTTENADGSAVENTAVCDTTSPVVGNSRFCFMCGTKVEQGQSFCHKCGAELTVVYNNQSAGQLNQQTKDKNKKRKPLWIALIAIAAVIIVAVGGASVMMYTCALSVADAIANKPSDINYITQQYEKLTPVGQKVFGSVIIDGFYEQVKLNPYKSNSAELVGPERGMRMRYRMYANIADVIDMSGEKGQTLDVYIDVVNGIYEYAKYDDLYKMVEDTYPYVSQAIEDLNNAEESYTTSMTRFYVNEAYNSIEIAYDNSFTYSSEYTADYFSAIVDLEYIIRTLCNGDDIDYDDEQSFGDAVRTVQGTATRVSGYKDQVENLEKSLPVL